VLTEARRLVEREGWANVELLQRDAGSLDLDREVDGVLFSLSYAIPDRGAARAGLGAPATDGRVVVLDAGFSTSRVLRRFDPDRARLLVKPHLLRAEPGALWTISTASSCLAAFSVLPISIPPPRITVAPGSKPPTRLGGTW
jgi:hypothetical protein